MNFLRTRTINPWNGFYYDLASQSSEDLCVFVRSPQGTEISPQTVFGISPALKNLHPYPRGLAGAESAATKPVVGESFLARTPPRQRHMDHSRGCHESKRPKGHLTRPESWDQILWRHWKLRMTPPVIKDPQGLERWTEGRATGSRQGPLATRNDRA